MSSKETELGNLSKQSNISLDNEVNNIYIYCISSFNKKINNVFELIAKNSEVISIKTLFKTNLKNYDDYDFIINEICVNKKIKNLNLCLSNNKVSYDLEAITIKSSEQKIILLDELIVSQNSINNLMDELALQESICIFKNMNIFDKFHIYMKFFEEQENKNKLKILLASKILSTLKKNNEIKFSILMSLFNITFGDKLITKFLDVYQKLDIDYDDINHQEEEFNKILKLYEDNNEEFFEKNLKFFSDVQKEKTIKTTKNKEDSQSKEKYKNLLENFIVLYKLMYEEPKDIEPQKLINVRDIFFNLIQNKNNLFKILNFIIEKFDILYLLYTKTNDKRYIIKPYLNESSPLIDYGKFNGIYRLLLTKQSEQFIFDFSAVFNYLVDKLNKLELLISLKNLYACELSTFTNDYFKENIIKKIHKIGFKEIMSDKKKIFKY